MTHRSRSGGPQQIYTQRKKTNGQSQPNGRKAGPSTATAAATTSTPNPRIPAPDRHPLTTTPSSNDILALIRHALSRTITSADFVPTVQKIKGLLYERKWLEAFGDEGLLEAYAGRWVPSRALCFRELLGASEEIRGALFGDEEEEVDEGGQGGPSARRVVSLGGGAGSELLAIASLAHGQRVLERQQEECSGSSAGLEWVGADYGPWTTVLDQFTDACNSLWSLDLRPECHQMNLLDTTASQSLKPLLTSDTRLVTLLFTVCELMSQSRPATIRLLHDLTSQLRPGGLLLIADSASDIAEFELGSSGRKWPVYMVLDAVMLGMKTDAGEENKWEKVDSEDSRWFRLAEGAGANWPVKLENTRYWYRLYRRV